MKLEYHGLHDAVDVTLPHGGKKRVKRNEPENLPDSLCVSLLQQPANWRRPADKPEPKPEAAKTQKRSD